MSISKEKRGNSQIKIGILGLGMVGEPIKRWFEEIKGYKRNKNLFCYDTDPKKDYNDDVNRADVIFVAVPSPTNPDGSCNVSIVKNAVASLNDGKIVVIKSTVAPGTVEELQRIHPKKKLIFNPEFLTEAQAWLDYIKPDRQIVAHTAKSYADTKEVLALLPRAHFERPWASDYIKKNINASEAELAKYASNVFGYIKVIYGNILADICHAMTLALRNDKIDSDVSYQNVRETISADARIGPAWLDIELGNYCGVGGYCFPKDMNALIKYTEKLTDGLEGKNKTDPGLTKALKLGVAFLKAAVTYNRGILQWQGLAIEDVSRHDKEVVTHKRKPIRIHGAKIS